MRWERKAKRRKRKSQPPIFSFERTLKRPDLSPRAAEYGFRPATATGEGR